MWKSLVASNKYYYQYKAYKIPSISMPLSLAALFCVIASCSAFYAIARTGRVSQIQMNAITDKFKIIKKAAPILGFYAVMLAPIYGIGLGAGILPGLGLGSITDFSKLRNRNIEGVISNEYILCPQTFCPKARVIEPSTYNVPAEQLLSTMDDVILHQPRITVIDNEDVKALKKEYVQRTLIFRFPDIITVQAIPLEASKSTLAIHSYSIYGAGDLGVNANRVKTFVAELEKIVSPSSP